MGDLTKNPFSSKHLHNVLAGKLQVLASAGALTGVFLRNTSGATVYLHLFDVTASPSDGDTPTYAPVPITTSSYYESDTPRGFANGCWLCVSTSEDTLTAVGTGVAVDASG